MSEIIIDIIIVVGVIFLLFFGLSSFDRFSCWQFNKDTQIETKYTIFNGCLVKTAKGFVPVKNWRAFQ